MKTILRISLILNLALLASLILFLVNQRMQVSAPLPVWPKSRPHAQAAAPLPRVTPKSKLGPFRWRQLESSKNYQAYIANLRAIGCPELTIEDIVRGDADRAFSWERRQLHLDGSGAGPWSRERETQLVASLLGQRTLSAESTVAVQNNIESLGGSKPIDDSSGTAAFSSSAANQAHHNAANEVAQTTEPTEGAVRTASSYPLFLQNVNWSALGFTAEQQAVIAQVRQQFRKDTANLGQNPSDSATLTQWQKALQTANKKLKVMGAQAYMAYQLQQYYAWYQPQVLAAAASGKPLIINPDAFSPK